MNQITSLIKILEQLSESHIKEIMNFTNFLKTKDNVEEAFYKTFDLDSMVLEQDLKPISNIQDYKLDFWSEEENIDDFLTNLKRWRKGC